MTHVWHELLPFVGLGLAGALHCLGMCGGFAFAVGATVEQGGRRRGLRLVAYVVGKSMTYAVLGVFVAHGAGLVAVAGVDVTRMRGVLAWLAGLALLLVGFGFLFRRPLAWSLPLGPLRGPWTVALSRGLSAVRSLPSSLGAFGTGVVTGLLPCGLSWSALLLAARLDPPLAALGMAAFGWATGPVLLLIGLGGPKWASRSVRGWRVVGAACVVLAVVTIARGGLPDALARGEAVLPECCRPAARSAVPVSSPDSPAR